MKASTYFCTFNINTHSIMITLISPAKTLDFTNISTPQQTLPRLLTKTNKLIRTARTLKTHDLKQLMSISDDLATLNVQRFKDFRQKHTIENSKTAIHAFKGDVYLGLDVDSLTNQDIDFAQSQLRMLSGLYGLLRPLDLIQPYRLEMGTSLKVEDNNGLYQFWGDDIAKLVMKDLKEGGDHVILNLASNEYFKSLKSKKLKAKVIDVDFLDLKNGKYKVISFFAKKARGMMSRYIIKNRINDPKDLVGFDIDGYYFDSSSSQENKLVFKRD